MMFEILVRIKNYFLAFYVQGNVLIFSRSTDAVFKIFSMFLQLATSKFFMFAIICQIFLNFFYFIPTYLFFVLFTTSPVK